MWIMSCSNRVRQKRYGSSGRVVIRVRVGM